MGMEVNDFEWTPNAPMMLVVFALTMVFWYHGVGIIYNYREYIPDVIALILIGIIPYISLYLIWSFFNWLFKMN